jgi:hypothetical protein
MRLLVPALLCAICWPAAATTPCLTPEAAMAVAEYATRGLAVRARLDKKHTAGFGTWVVRVHMPGEDQGWRCFISRDTGMLLKKMRIPNPPAPRGR